MTEDTLAVVPTEKSQEEDMDSYFDDGRIFKYSKGETIINGMDEPNGVYIIKKALSKHTL